MYEMYQIVDYEKEVYEFKQVFFVLIEVIWVRLRVLSVKKLKYCLTFKEINYER